MISINPIKLLGKWDEGYALDKHTIRSVYIGDDPFGNPQYDTKRTEIGDLLFKLKYRNDLTTIDDLSEVASSFLSSSELAQNTNIVLPVPATRKREFQPVYLIAEAIAEKIGVFYYDEALVKKSFVEAKNYDKSSGAIKNVEVEYVKSLKYPCSILLIDDIYNTGSTLNACVDALRQDPNAQRIFVLTMTKTKG